MFLNCLLLFDNIIQRPKLISRILSAWFALVGSVKTSKLVDLHDNYRIQDNCVKDFLNLSARLTASIRNPKCIFWYSTQIFHLSTSVSFPEAFDLRLKSFDSFIGEETFTDKWLLAVASELWLLFTSDKRQVPSNLQKLKTFEPSLWKSSKEVQSLLGASIGIWNSKWRWSRQQSSWSQWWEYTIAWGGSSEKSLEKNIPELLWPHHERDL